MSDHLPSDYYTPFLSRVAQERKPSPIRSLLPLESRPGLISLLAGKPNASTFPFTSLSFTVRCPPHTPGDEPAPPVALSLSEPELAEAFQYGATAGLGALREWVEGLQEREHGRTRVGQGWRVSVGTGSQDLINKTITSMVNPGDVVFVEAPTYAGVIPMFQALHCEIIEIETDASGICSLSLRAILETWPEGKPKPRVLYTVPYGCNPTGMTATLERRKEVLALSREHDFIILEDDPYYYLYFGPSPRPPSYFALELENPPVGRVLRFDSLSKILSAGIRIGFVSGPERLLNAIDMNTAISNLHTPTLTQIIVLKLLTTWGYDGFQAHTLSVSEFYRKKRDVFDRLLRKHMLPQESGACAALVEWSRPESGMFFWFKLILPPSSDGAEGESEQLIRTDALERGVLALPGTVFSPSGQKTAYVRAAFSLLEEEEVDEALRRLREVLVQARKNAGD